MSNHTRRCALTLVIAMACAATRGAAQTDPYPKMAPIDRYEMDSTAEIVLARSAAPAAISRDASILVLGRNGYATAVQGTNGFVCWVGRSWMAAFDWPEFWNPQVRAAECMNPQAARSILPIIRIRGRLAMAGSSKAEMLSAVKAAYARGEVPALEAGAMDYMMSKSAYLTDEGEHNTPHVMFFTAAMEAKDWGAGAEGSPVMGAPYWFFGSNSAAQMKGLPPLMVFLVGVASWSDGTLAGTHHQ